MESVEKQSLFSVQLWARHEAHYFIAFLRALELLGQRPSLPIKEVDLNRELYFCLLQANRELDPDGTYPPPVTECCNQPDPDDNARAERESKRPDFSWGFTDPHEPDYRKSAKQLTVECKRLGAPPTPDWILNKNYLEHGILRFVNPTWGYAQRFPSAVMIGYWQTMDGEEILKEVTLAIEAAGLTAMRLSGAGWQIAAVSRLDHLLSRPFPVSPFRLHHLWIDLRGKLLIPKAHSIPPQTVKTNKKRKVLHPRKRSRL